MSGWPRVSETFAINELVALHRRGMLAAIIATKPGDASMVQPDTAVLDGLVTVLDPCGDPLASARAAVEAAGGVDAVHGYFAHRPAELADHLASHLGVPFGFSVHALDVRKVPPGELRERAGRAAVVVTCNGDASTTLRELRIEHRLVPHGVDTTRFAPRSNPDPDDAIHLVAVGRLVEKKGFAHLLEAMADIDPRVHLTIHGEGPERRALEAQVARLGLDDRVELPGRVTHAELPDLYRRAHIAVVPSVVDRNGDRDGLPNVVLEAMASGLPIVASDVAAIASAFCTDGPPIGLLIPPADSAAISRTVNALASAPAEVRRFGRGARKAAMSRFDLGRCSARFVDLLERRYG